MFVPEKARETQTDEIEFLVNFEWPKKGSRYANNSTRINMCHHWLIERGVIS